MYDMNKIKPVPDGFYDWMDEQLPAEPIFFKNHRQYSDLICGYCGEKSTIYMDAADMFELPSEKPVRGKLGICPLCRHEGRYEIGQVTARHGGYIKFVLIHQDADRNLITRIFEASHFWQKGHEREASFEEVERYVQMPGHMIKIKQEWRIEKGKWVKGWTECKNGRMTFEEKATLFEDYKSFSLRNEIKTSKLAFFDPDVYTDCFNVWERECGDGYNTYYVNTDDYAARVAKSLALFAHSPYTESFCKMGWSHVVRDLKYTDGASQLINRRGKTLKSQLRIKDGQHLSMFRKFMKQHPNNWRKYLEAIQMAERAGRKLNDKQLAFFGQLYNIKEATPLLKYMTVEQLINRLEDYRAKREADTKRPVDLYSVFVEYRDYINLRERLGYNMKNEVFIHPKDLRGKHKELITEERIRRDEERGKELDVRYKKITEIFEKLCKIYCWESEGYIIRPAKTASEFVTESRELHHCVGSSNTYMEKHAKGESFILFLRAKETPDKPFTTIEITGKGNPRILQWYEAYDEQPDEEILQPIIDKYVEHLKKGMVKPGKRAKAS